MTEAAMNSFIDALKTGAGLKDEFIYYMSFERLPKLSRSVSPHKICGSGSSRKHPQIPESRKTRRAFSVGYSWPAIHTR